MRSRNPVVGALVVLSALAAPGVFDASSNGPFGVATAYAQPVPVADVDDLPPLPEASDEDAEGRLAVASAAAVEEDLVTGAAKREQSLGNVASAVTVVSGDRLRRFGYRTVAEALRAVAGLYVVDDHMSSRLGVRGLQLLGDFNTRVLVLVDGATVNEPWGQFAGIGWDVPFTIDEVARIEVIRGPVSSVYGTNAFFGIINIVTRGAGESPRAWGRVTAGAFGSGSASSGFTIGDVDHQIRGSVSALYRGGETFTIPDIGGEPVQADGERAVSGSLVGAYEGAFAQLRFFRKIRELAGSPYDSALGDPSNRNYDTQLLAEGGYTHEFGKRLSVTARGYLNTYRFEDYLVYSDPGPFQDFGDATWYGGEVRARWSIVSGEHGDRLGLTAGGEATFISTESRSFYLGMEGDGTTVPQDFNLQGLYTEVDASPLSWLSVTGGVRLDQNSELQDRVSPHAALFLSRGEEYGFKFLYAQGFRNPSAYEGFFDDGTDFAANPDIGAENITSYEAVLWGRPWGRLSTRLSAFLWQADDLVEQEEVDFGDGETRLQFLNVGGLTSRGLEGEATYRDSSGWLAFIGAGYANVERDAREGEDSGTRELNSPLMTASGGVSTPLIRDLAHVSSELVYVGERKTRDPMFDAAPFFGWNAAVYFPDIRNFDLTVGVRNIIGRREEVPTQEDYDRTDPAEATVRFIPGEGREVYARLGFRY